MSALSCLTCAVFFESHEERENHFRSEWHSYNVKRKVASLAPLSLSLFEERQRHLNAAQNKNATPTKIYCNICKKAFSSKNAFVQHEKSKKHLKEVKDAEARKAQEEETKNSPKEENTDANEVVKEENPENPVSSDDEKESKEFSPEDYEFNSSRCLFCGFISDSVDLNLSHMKKQHSFIIPDQDSLIDLEGLLDYLAQKISIGCVCLGCNHGFKSPHAVRGHMIAKGHTKIAYETDEDYEEFEEFYDYSDANEHPLSELTVIGTGEVQLPDGKILGNREFARYYKQVYRNENEKRESILNKLLLENGNMGKQSSALMIYETKKVELLSKHRDTLRLNRYDIRERLRTGIAMNKIHLNHFSHR